MSVSVKIIKDEFTPFIKKLIRKLDDPTTALAKIGILEKSQTQLRFRREINPQGNAWKPLAPKTIQRKNSAVILTDTGRLRRSIQYVVQGNRLFIGTNVKYGKTHQFGNSSKNIPRREFLGINEQTKKNVITVFERFLGR